MKTALSGILRRAALPLGLERLAVPALLSHGKRAAAVRLNLDLGRLTVPALLSLGKLAGMVLLAMMGVMVQPLSAQGFLQRMDSLLTVNYRQGDIDPDYLARPETKWTFTVRQNVSGARIKPEGTDHGSHFRSEMTADYKSTFSVAVSYLGFSLGLSLNPGKLMGKYSDYELNFNSYGQRFGFDIAYQDAHNFTGWHDMQGMARIELPAGILSVKTMNLNTYYAFNNRRFSYPAAFSQSYIQRRSAGSFLVAMSGQGQHATLDWEQEIDLKMTNIGIGAGYGYNYVPSQGWLLHLSSLPTFIVYSNTSMIFGDTRVPLDYHFPEFIVTTRASVVHQWRNKFLGLSMVLNFTNIGYEESLAVHNIKWRIRAFFGVRL
ncbi:MAG: DUF4421 family protein [Bacteroidales bacterium]|nr:DUF4421 family protein [Bacteroidales bacterium]